MKRLRKIIEIDEERCDGCGLCVPSCAEGAIQIIDGKARLAAEKYCDGLGACLGECPNGALRIVERLAEDFDEKAVEDHLQTREKTAEEATTLACGCPSTRLQSFTAADPCETANRPRAQAGSESTLGHWPVQIRLVPANAPFLKGAELLVTADCAPLAYPRFHQDLLKGKVVLMGCPKFDDVQEYIAKFTEIFQKAGIKKVTTVVMEVPCCSGLPFIVHKALAASGQHIPLEEKVIGIRGEIKK